MDGEGFVGTPLVGLTPAQLYARIAEAQTDPQTFWQAMTIRDTADGMDLHPLIVGLLFELPFARSGRPVWTMSQRDRWLELAERIVDICYFVCPDEDDPESALFKDALTDIAVRQGVIDAPEPVGPKDQAEATQAPEGSNRPEAAPATKAASTNGHGSPVDLLDFKRHCIALAREKGQDADVVLGYAMTPESVRRNREGRGWDRYYLATACGVHPNVVERAEEGHGWQDWQGARMAAAFVLSEGDGDE